MSIGYTTRAVWVCEEFEMGGSLPPVGFKTLAAALAYWEERDHRCRIYRIELDHTPDAKLHITPQSRTTAVKP